MPIDHGFFPGFSPLRTEAGDVVFGGVIGGSGSPVLLLHGYPQTHVAWRFIAAKLAETHTVVVPDLPGYGASRTLSATPRWSKRRVAGSLVALMNELGHSRFAVVGHDRGARVGYRMALDHAERVSRYASLTVVPTLDAWEKADRAFGVANFHWFFLAQPFDLPERLLVADPDAFIDSALAKMAGGIERIDPDALAAYRAAFREPSVRHAMCEDYRCAIEEDLDADRADQAAGRRLACPVLVLWEAARAGTPSPLDIWRRWANEVSGLGISGGHLQPEESPDQVLRALLPFLCGTESPD